MAAPGREHRRTEDFVKRVKDLFFWMETARKKDHCVAKLPSETRGLSWSLSRATRETFSHNHIQMPVSEYCTVGTSAIPKHRDPLQSCRIATASQIW